MAMNLTKINVSPFTPGHIAAERFVLCIEEMTPGTIRHHDLQKLLLATELPGYS